MITDAKEVLQHKSLPASLWSQAVCHAAWIKNHTFTHSLHSKITLYQAYLKLHPFPHSISSAAKLLPTYKGSTKPSLVNVQLTAYMLALLRKKRLTCSIAKSIGSCFNLRMLILRNWWVGNE